MNKITEVVRGSEEQFVEQGANLEHDRWARWQAHMFSKGFIFSTQDSNPPELGSFVLPKEFVDRWFRQVNTSYEKLSEQEKESDRKETRNYLPLLCSSLLSLLEAVEGEIGTIREGAHKVVFTMGQKDDFESGQRNMKIRILEVLSEAKKELAEKK